MDVMQIRRMLMSTIGGSAMVGKLTKYQKVIVNETSDFNPLTVNHSLGMKPKFISITCAEDASARQANGSMLEFVGNDRIGGSLATNSSTGQATQRAGLSCVESGSAVQPNFLSNDTQISIPRQGSSYSWKANTDYIVELYA